MASGPSSLSRLLHHPPQSDEIPGQSHSRQPQTHSASTGNSAGQEQPSSFQSQNTQVQNGNTYPQSYPHQPSEPPLFATPRSFGGIGAASQAHPASSSPVTTSSAAPEGSEAAAGQAPTPPAAAASSNTPGLYQCAHCQRRYSRPEHLARHVQIHTLGKRFVCDVCGKAFARQDLLKRHAANHENDGDPNKKRRRTTASSPSSARVSQACRACATARVKCEESKPCARCKSRNVTCEYAAGDSTFAAAMHVPHLSPANWSATPAPQLDVASPTPVKQQQTPQLQIHDVPMHPYYAAAQGNEGLDIPQPTSSAQARDSLSLGEAPAASTGPDLAVAASNPPPENNGDIQHQAFSDFLQNVMFESSLHDSFATDEAQGLAVLDLGAHGDLGMTDVDFSLLDHWNMDFSVAEDPPVQANTPSTDDSVDLPQMRRDLVKVWTDSPWVWHPSSVDSGYDEQRNLRVSSREANGAVRERRRKLGESVIAEKLDQAGRDGVLAIMLETCRTPDITARVVGSFPSTEVMDSLIHIYLASHFCETPQWIHQGTFKMGGLGAEWLAMAAASGAILTPVPTLHRWGFAVQEAARVIIPYRFESSNANVGSFGILTALAMSQDVALWSGNRRKMEIAECLLSTPATMVRYRGKFRHSNYPIIEVTPSDSKDVLDRHWRSWSERESWKRFVFHCFVREAQASMMMFISPYRSYAEMTLPLPEARDVWFAKSASEWRDHYLARIVVPRKPLPNVGDLFRDMSILAANRDQLDVQCAICIYLHGYWALIKEFQQLCASLQYRPWVAMAPNNHNDHTATATATAGQGFLGPREQLLRSRYEELRIDLQNFQNMTSEWPEVTAKETLLMHLLLMNLHLSLDDLQLFSGREGEAQARQVYGSLRQWAQSPEARQSLWHAGQVLRRAKMFPPGHLKDFYAVSVYHAVLAFWAYGVVTKAAAVGAAGGSKPTIHFRQPSENERVFLDGPLTAASNQFIGYGQGWAMIRGVEDARPGPGRGGQGGRKKTTGSVMEASIEDPQGCMEIAQVILRSNFKADKVDGHQPALPPIVENMCQLMKQLGNVAVAVVD